MKYNKTLNTLLIQESYKKYQNIYKIALPKIKDIKYIKVDDFWAQFITQDLYNKKYILHVNIELMSKSNKFIKQILFHEFTHLSDSLFLLEHTCEDFINIMQSYSEYHSSEIEMMERLSQVTINDFDSYIVYDKGNIPIKDLIKTKLDNLISDILKMNENCKGDSFFYETANLYYYCGYLKAIKSYGLNYNAYKIDILKLPPTPISPICCDIFDYLIKDDVDYNAVLQMNKQLDHLILLSAKLNKISKTFS